MDFLWFLESLRTPAADRIMQLITCLGEETAIILVLCLLYWCISKELALKISFAYFLAGLAVQTLKVTFRIPRPWVLDPAFSPVGSAVPAATGYSFPSGHTQSAACLYGTLGLRSSRKGLRSLFFAMVLLVGLSRMYLGCHTPWDVLASLAVSALFIWLTDRLLLRLTSGRIALRLLFALLLLACLGVIVCALLLVRCGLLSQAYAVDCFKAAGAGLGFAVGWYLETTRLRFQVTAPRLWMQALKFAAGICGIFLLNSCIPLIAGKCVIAKIIKYFILVLWIMVIYPALFSRVVPPCPKK